ncbi:MAG: efflux transporter outer membrane subunit, partial [Acidiferrobacter sp.]
LLALTKMQYRAGAVPYLSVVNQESQLATSKASLPGLLQQLALARYALAVLIGEFPAQWHPIHLKLSDLYLPRHLPVSLPSTLVRDRPDIRAATEQLRYANAAVGIADAQFYPTVQITAAFGQESLTPGSFFNAASSVWSVGAGLLAPIFHGGTLRAQRREALALYAGSLATYQQTVLGAFQQVAGALRALTHDAQALHDERDAYQAAREALLLAKESYRAGAIDSLSLLTTEAQYSQARIAYVRAEAQRYLDTVGLYTAIGGGRLPPPPSLLGPPEAAASPPSVSTATPQRNAQ